MQRLQQLVENLDTTSKESIKIEALKHYFQSVPAEDAAWALYFLEDRKVQTKISLRVLKDLVHTLTGLPIWLIDGSNHRVNDYAETLALMLPQNSRTSELSLSTLVLQFIQPLAGFSPMARRDTIRCAWENLNTSQRVLFNKMLTGGFKINLTKDDLHDALAQISGSTKNIIARRLVGDWTPSSSFFNNLIKPVSDQERTLNPYPFANAKELVHGPETLGSTKDWFVEWNEVGIRVQVIRRKEHSAIWSQDLNPLDEVFPELVAACDLLPSGTVIEGMITPKHAEEGESSALLKKRLRRKKHPKTETIPVVIKAQDLLELRGVDLRGNEFSERRKQLNQVLTEWEQQWKIHGGTESPSKINPDFFQQEMFAIEDVVVQEPTEDALPAPMMISELGTIQDWESIQDNAPAHQTEGILLKHIASPYLVSPESGSRWHWFPRAHKANLVLAGVVRPPQDKHDEPLTYMFAVMDGDSPVLVGKTNQGMDASTTEMLEAWIPKNTIKKQGPAHLIQLEHVFEMAFNDLSPAPRSAAKFKLEQLKIIKRMPHLNPDHACRLEELKSLET